MVATDAATAIPGLDQARVSEFLREALPGVEDAFGFELIAGGRSNLTYRVRYGDRSLALRRPPLDSGYPYLYSNTWGGCSQVCSAFLVHYSLDTDGVQDDLLSAVRLGLAVPYMPGRKEVAQNVRGNQSPGEDQEAPSQKSSPSDL